MKHTIELHQAQCKQCRKKDVFVGKGGICLACVAKNIKFMNKEARLKSYKGGMK